MNNLIFNHVFSEEGNHDRLTSFKLEKQNTIFNIIDQINVNLAFLFKM